MTKVDKKKEALGRAKMKVKTMEQIEAEIDALRDDVNEMKKEFRVLGRDTDVVTLMFKSLSFKLSLDETKGRA